MSTLVTTSLIDVNRPLSSEFTVIRFGFFYLSNFLLSSCYYILGIAQRLRRWDRLFGRSISASDSSMLEFVRFRAKRCTFWVTGGDGILPFMVLNKSDALTTRLPSHGLGMQGFNVCSRPLHLTYKLQDVSVSLYLCHV